LGERGKGRADRGQQPIREQLALVQPEKIEGKFPQWYWEIGHLVCGEPRVGRRGIYRIILW